MSRESPSCRQRHSTHTGGAGSATLGYPHQSPYIMSRQGPVPPQMPHADPHMYYPAGRDGFPQAPSGFGQYPGKSGTGMGSSKTSLVGQRAPKTFTAVAKDCLKAVEKPDAIAVLTCLSAAMLHHFRNRNSNGLVPFPNPRWVEYVCNAMSFYSVYSFAKERGLVGSSRAVVREQRMSGAPSSAPGTRGIADVAQRPAPTPASRGPRTPVPAAAAADIHQLFGSAAVEPGNAINEYDARWAVPKEVARRHHHAVYHAQLDLRSAGPQVLGGAAAIQALRKETAQQRMHQDSGTAAHYADMLTVMDCALVEVDSLLRRKAAAAKLAPADTLENVGRIALATIIKIKMDQRRPDTPMPLSPVA
ncbi:hypothetical protein H4R19_001147 [Coemansia spiralis]|nr:hypothetical protein H4R19_001147 [Coemansia spiralis]